MLCEWLGLFCAASASRVPVQAPEIDAANLLGAVALVVIVTLIWEGRR